MVDKKSIPRNSVRKGKAAKLTQPHRDRTKYRRKEKHENAPTHPNANSD